MKENSDIQAHQVLEDLRLNYGPKKKFVTICAGTGCRAYGSLKVKEALEAEIKKQNMKCGRPGYRLFGFLRKRAHGRHSSR